MSLAFDPFFRDLDRWATGMLGRSRAPQAMPVDAYRDGENYVVEFDLPGIDPDSLEVKAENNTLTVRAERHGRLVGEGGSEVSYLINERPRGTFSRQLSLGEGLDLDRISADYTDGVLTVTLPVAERAKPRRIEVGHGSGRKVVEGSTG